MKTIRVVTVICWVVISAIFLGLIGWFFSGTVFGLRPAWIDRNMPFRVGIGGTESLAGPFNVVGTYTANPDGITSIEIDWISGEIIIRPHEGDQIEISELVQRNLHDNERLSMTISGDTLEIDFLSRTVATRIGRMPAKRLEVLVPNALAQNLISLEIRSVSGRVEISDMSINDIDVGTTSGNIYLSNIISSDIEVSSTSGIINISDSSSTSLDLDTTSGRINATGAFSRVDIDSTSGAVSLNNTTVQSVANVDTTSGAIELSGAFYSIETDTSSGGVSIRSIIVPSTLSVETTSGTVSLTIPNEGSITVRHSSGSGRFNSDIPVVLQNRGAQFTFSTRSGNVNIFELR